MGHIIDLYDYANASKSIKAANKRVVKDNPLVDSVLDIGEAIFIWIPAVIIGGGLLWLICSLIGWGKVLGFLGFCVVGAIISVFTNKS